MKLIVRYNSRGFALLLVLAFLALISAAMLVFTTCSRSLQTQANALYANACIRNLTASGLVYAQTLDKNSVPKVLNPDPNALGIPKAKLILSIARENTSHQEQKVIIKTTCTIAARHYSNETFNR